MVARTPPPLTPQHPLYRSHTVAVVVPAYNEERLLPQTLETMPAYVDHIIVVDDTSTDGTAAAAQVGDPRVDLVIHPVNGGVGAAIVTGYQRALELGADAIVVMAADAQMDPADLPGLLEAIDEGADYAKGDRLAYPGVKEMMPPARLAGTWLLALLTRWPSGYTELRDSQCGYTVIRSSALERLPLDALYPRYGFPNDILARLGDIDAVMAQRPVRPVYGPEVSGLRIPKVVLPITRILAAAAWRRWRREVRRARHRAGHRVRRWTGITALLMAASLLAGALAGVAVAPIEAQESSESAPHPAMVRVTEAVDIITQHYHEPIDAGELIHSAAFGLVSSLDKHSRFLPPKSYHAWKSRIHGRMVGIGLTLHMGIDGVRIEAVSPTSPAALAGVQGGDLLLLIDGEELKSLPLSELRARLRGETGTTVTIRVKREANGDVMTHTLTRKKVRAVPVEGTLLDGGVAHIIVRNFQDGAARDVLLTMDALTAKRGRPPVGMVLDLRGNLGGLLEESLIMTDLFLPPDHVIVSLEHRGEISHTHTTQRSMALDLPMVVLVNGRSASASELLAAALRDHGRARIVGWPTYGKGSVQSTYALEDGSGLKITTSYYVTPSGAQLKGNGVMPDVSVVLSPVIGADDGLQRAAEVVISEAIVLGEP